ncbi:MAG: hypothetical protein ABH823_05360 [bacterium]
MFYLEAICSSLIVGLGQIIKGDSRKGLVLILIFYFALPTLVYTSLMINGYVFLWCLTVTIITAIILWLYSIVDGLKST